MIEQKTETSTEEKEKKPAEDSNTADNDVELNKLARKYRHIGFAIFGSIAVILAGFLTYSAITAYTRGDVYDPFTHERYAK